MLRIRTQTVPQDPSRLTVKEPLRPTLKTIAFMTGLGVTTVSKALKDAPDIGKATKARVRLVAKQIGYRPNRAGVRLRTGKTSVIALVLSTEESVMGLTSHLVHGISEVLSETQYHLVLTPYSYSGDPMEPIRYITETAAADGIIFSRTEPNDPRVRYLDERDFPFATHGRTDMGIDHPWHDFDNWRFAREAAERLISLGRRRLSLLGPQSSLTFHRHLTGGFSEGIRHSSVVEVPLAGVNLDYSLDQLRAYIMQVMSGPERPDGIICCAGGATFGLVAGIEAAGLEVGKDIDVVAKQSTNVLPWFRPQIQVVNEDIRHAGRELAMAILKRIEGQDPKGLQSLSAPVWG
ncbi:MAG: LacI family DNA-binding transcriptional regulator [Rhodospirillales bacterium]|nr:LacI family DNA-binding transcriptional regulator [Rhodospirillales bacterium]